MKIDKRWIILDTMSQELYHGGMNEQPPTAVCVSLPVGLIIYEGSDRWVRLWEGLEYMLPELLAVLDHKKGSIKVFVDGGRVTGCSRNYESRYL